MEDARPISKPVKNGEKTVITVALRLGLEVTLSLGQKAIVAAFCRRENLYFIALG